MDDDSILVSIPTTKHDQEEGDALVDTHTHTYTGDLGNLAVLGGFSGRMDVFGFYIVYTS